MLRRSLLWAARQQWLRGSLVSAPITRGIVSRFVAGTDVDEAIDVVRDLTGAGLQVSLDHLGEDTTDRRQAMAARDAYLLLIDRLAGQGLATGADLSVKLSALGQALDPGLAEEHARSILSAASAASATVTVDAEDHSTTDATLSTVGRLRRDHPATGAVLQAYLYRTLDDSRRLAAPGSRVRLCKGAYDEPGRVAYQRRADVDRSFVRCLDVLLGGPGYPMIATHDPRIIRIAQRLLERYGRSPGSYEFQMLYGVRPDEQRRLAGLGGTVRVYVPYGDEWYGYLMRRIAERPANLAFFARALVSRG